MNCNYHECDLVNMNACIKLGNNQKLDMININTYIKLAKFCQFVLKILSGSEILEVNQEPKLWCKFCEKKG